MPKKRRTPAQRAAAVRPKLDVRPDRLDFRDLNYRAPLRSLPAAWPTDADLAQLLPAYVRAGLILNQGSEGACTGFGLACVANYLLWLRHRAAGTRKPFALVSPRMFYELARRYDEWPGANYEGSSCRGALKGWHKHGVCSSELWPYTMTAKGKAVFVPPQDGWDRDAAQRPLGVYYRIKRDSVVDMQSAIAEIGAVYVSATVHDGWDALARTEDAPAPRGHAEVPVIGPLTDPDNIGGHAFALVGYNQHGFIVQNSWGARWGAGGFAVLTYADWVANGSDAWACALGVPTSAAAGTSPVVSHAPLPAGRAVSVLARNTRVAANPADDPWPFEHEFQTPAYEPLTTERAYDHTLVSGNDGQIVVRDLNFQFGGEAAAYARSVILERPLAWAQQQPAGPVKLALYAHGGLNSEEDSVQRIRVLAPYFIANDIYPLFSTWRTGPGETVASAVQDWIAKIPGFDAERSGGVLEWAAEKFAEEKDRALEAIGRLFGRGIWSEMRENAERAVQPDQALDLLARNLCTLAKKLGADGRPLELHLIGHSAGTILLGHLLQRLLADDLRAQAPQVQTCTLYAAACSVRFANQHYLPAADAGLLDLGRLWLHCLSDQNERADALPSPAVPVYGKSLLYLVSRALDETRKIPLLGFERALRTDFARPTTHEEQDQWDAAHRPELATWQARWPGVAEGDDRLRLVRERDVRITRAGRTAPATHGSFDNNIAELTATLERVKGGALIAPLEWLDY
jgi:hypothetical protein